MDIAQRRTLAKEEMARILMEVKAVGARPQDPFTLTSGSKSPIYIDVRRLISFVKERERAMGLLEFLVSKEVEKPVGAVAGGETAGIPFAAFLSQRMQLPMLYVRKKAKGFGRNAQVEGFVEEGTHAILVEDLMFDGGSKVTFVEGLRSAGLLVEHVFVLACYGLYDEYEETFNTMGIKTHSVTDWPTIVDIGEDTGYFSEEEARVAREFLKDPHKWSLEHGGK